MEWHESTRQRQGVLLSCIDSYIDTYRGDAVSGEFDDIAETGAMARSGLLPASIDPRYVPGTWNAPVPEVLRFSEDGYLEWPRPERKLDDDGNVVWHNLYGFRTIEPDARLLSRFMALADSDAGGVLAFARRYGPLAPGFPLYSGMPREFSLSLPARLMGIVEFLPSDSSTAAGSRPRLALRESVAGWIALATEARAMVLIADSLHKGRVVHKDAWKPLYRNENDMGPVTDPDSFEEHMIPLLWSQRALLASSFFQWSIGAIRGLDLRWWDSIPRLSIEGFALFGTLALRLAGAIVRSDQFEQCHNCDGWFNARQDSRRTYPFHCPARPCQSALASLRTAAMRQKIRSEAKAAGVSVAEVKRRRAAQRARK